MHSPGASRAADIEPDAAWLWPSMLADMPVAQMLFEALAGL